MNDLAITIKIEKEKEYIYKFSKLPILIGRDPDCDLSICHSSIPRKLCSVWIDKQNNTICVEETPNLTNPIHLNNKQLKGGASGKTLNLKVGPVTIFICNSTLLKNTDNIKTKNLTKKIKFNQILLGFSALFAILIAIASSISNPNNQIKKESLPGLVFTIKKREDINIAQARLMISRAAELQNRRPEKISNMIDAIELLDQTIPVLKKHSQNKALTIQNESSLLKQQLKNRYRIESLNLKRNIELDNKPEIKRAASHLLEFLKNSNNNKLKTKLQKLTRL